MKNTFKRITFALISGILLFSALSCGAVESHTDTADTFAQQTSSSGQSETEAPSLIRELPDKDMDGFELRIKNADPSVFSWSHILITTEQDGEQLNDAIYMRNVNLESKYNCVIGESRKKTDEDELTMLTASGDNAYDLYMVYDMGLPAVIGCLASWDTVPYVNLKEAWWNPDATGIFNINNKQYATAGNFTLSYLSRAMCYLFNKNLFEELGLNENLYQTVGDGKWTTDRFFTLAAGAVSDINGDGKFNADDRYGVFGNYRAYYNTIISGAGIRYIESDSSGGFVYNLLGNEKAVSFFEKIIDFDTSNPNLTFNKSANVFDISNNTLFQNGHALFHIQGLPHTIATLRQMEDEFGIIPTPKYDESQTEYYSAAYGGLLTTIPKTADPERYENIGILMEDMTYTSYNEIVPLYKDVMLKTKYSRDEDSSAMLDIIFHSITFDPGIVIWCGSLPDRICAEMFMKHSKEVVSYLTENDNAFKALIDDFNKALQ